MISFPSKVTYLFNIFGFINFASVHFGSPQCSIDYRFDYVDSMILETLMPISISLLFLVCYLIQTMILSLNFHKDKIKVLRIHQADNGETAGPKQAETPVVTEAVAGIEELKKKYEHDVALTKSRYLNLFLLVTYLTLPSVTTMLFGAFNCVETDPDKVEPEGVSTRFLRNDVTIACDSPRYTLGVGYAVVLIMVYPIGVPLMYYYFLRNNKREIKRIGKAMQADHEAEEKKAQNKGHHAHGAFGENKLAKLQEELKVTVNPSSKPFGVTYRELKFLYKAYEGRCWYWEVVETIRKLLLTAVLSVCGEGSGFQIVIGIFIAIIFVKLYALYSPYVDDEDDYLQELAQYQILFTLFSALIIRTSIFNGDWATPSLASSLILINISTTFYTIHAVFYENVSHYADFIDEVPNKIIEIIFMMLCVQKKADDKEDDDDNSDAKIDDNDKKLKEHIASIDGKLGNSSDYDECFSPLSFDKDHEFWHDDPMLKVNIDVENRLQFSDETVAVDIEHQAKNLFLLNENKKQKEIVAKLYFQITQLQRESARYASENAKFQEENSILKEQVLKFQLKKGETFDSEPIESKLLK